MRGGQTVLSQNPSSGVGTAIAPDIVLLKKAVLAFRSGDKQLARDLLLEASEHNPDNELVWLWRASAARTRNEAYDAVVRVLNLNPQNEKALHWIEKLRPEGLEPSPAPEQAQAPASQNGHAAASAAVAEESEEKASAVAEVQEEAKAEEQETAAAEEQEQARDAAAEEAPAQSSEETAQAAPIAVSEPVDDAEARLAALEAALDQAPREQASDSETEPAGQAQTSAWPDREEARREASGSTGEDADDLLARLAESGSASESAKPAAVSPERVRADAEDDVWASLGMAGMDGKPAAKAAAASAGVAASEPADRASETATAPAAAAPPKRVAATVENATCFICEKYAKPQEGYCSSCRAIVDLELLDLAPRHEGADRAQLTRAIERLREELEKHPTAELLIQAAITCLNLRQSQQALVYLREACRLRPHDRELVGYYDRLEKRPLILAVDDSKTVQKMISTVLEKEAYRIVQAEDGLSAIAKLDEELPKLILLDITMPRMDGYQVCKVITGNDATKHIPVIMLSGKDGFFDKVRGKMVGASNYITKPFDPGDLTKSIAKFIKN